MTGIELTAYSGAILGPIAKFLGWVMNGIYMAMYNLFGIESIVLSIILLTILIYMCMLPLTIKQQKFSKLSQKMQPEIQAIQKKYKNKKDQASLQAMNQETQLVYQKYGVSPTGTCLPMLIQMPILLALYRVFFNVPAYVGSIKSVYSGLADEIISAKGFDKTLNTIISDFNLKNLNVDFSTSGSELKNFVIDTIYKLPSEGWDKLGSYFPDATTIESTFSHVKNFNFFLGLNISDTPWNIMKVNFASHNYLLAILAIAIPVLSCLTQFLNIKLMPQADTGNDQMAQQMKTMNLMMPLMSLFFCFITPTGLGIYWIASALVRVIQQFIINKHFSKLDLDEVIRQNQEKQKKRMEKLGISENSIRSAAQLNTKSFNDTAVKKSSKSGSMASKANMVRDYNERNSQK